MLPCSPGHTALGPSHNPVTWNKINYAGIQITQCDFQNKGTSSSPARISCNLHPSLIYSAPCDQIVERACSEPFSKPIIRPGSLDIYISCITQYSLLQQNPSLLNPSFFKPPNNSNEKFFTLPLMSNSVIFFLNFSKLPILSNQFWFPWGFKQVRFCCTLIFHWKKR